MPFIRRHWPWLALALGLSALYLTDASSELGGHLGGDNVTYFMLGKAIAEGEGYVDLSAPGNPVHRKYPFLLPLLLAPFHLVFDRPLLPIHVMICLCWAASFVVFGLILERRLGDRRAAVALALLAGLTPRMYTQGTHLLSEGPYVLFCYAAILAATPARPKPPDPGPADMTPAPAEPPPASWRALAAVTALALCAYYTRTAALGLGAALFLTLARDRARFRAGRLPGWLLFGAVFGAGVTAWWLFARGGKGFAYIGEFMSSDPYDLTSGRASVVDLLYRLAQNSLYFLPLLAMLSITPMELGDGVPALVLGAGALGGLAFFAGAVREFRRGNGALELFFAFSLAIVLLWPFQEHRFILPLVPLAIYYFFSMLDGLAGRFRPARRTQVLAAVYGVLVIFAAVQTARLVRNRLEPDLAPHQPVRVLGFGLWTEPVANWSKYDWNYKSTSPEELDILDVMTDYLIINRVLAVIAPPGSIILSRKPTITYFTSGRKSVPILANDDPHFQWDYIRKHKVDYIVTGVEEDALLPLVQKSPDHFQLAAEVNSRALIYRVLQRDLPLDP